jgi:ABC-type sulfate/molybdate transport systems ATPase subunit
VGKQNQEISFLDVRDISMAHEDRLVLSGISFQQRRAQKIAIAGETGSGKSSLLKIIAGLLQPASGQILFEGKPVQGPDERLVPGHPDIHYLSQHFELQKFLRVEQILTYANILPDADAKKLFEICHISHLMSRRSDELSGGEKQRVAIAKILISSPKLLLLDEPYSNLDMVHKKILRSVIRNIAGKLKISCVLISHDPDDTLTWADRVMVMKDGQVVQSGSPEKIYHHPQSEYVAALFGNYNLLPVHLVKDLFGKVEIAGSGEWVVVRPEQILLGNRGRSAAHGVIKRQSFAGSHYEIKISTSSADLLAACPATDFSRGDDVYVSLNTDVLWSLSR